MHGFYHLYLAMVPACPGFSGGHGGYPGGTAAPVSTSAFTCGTQEAVSNFRLDIYEQVYG